MSQCPSAVLSKTSRSNIVSSSQFLLCVTCLGSRGATWRMGEFIFNPLFSGNFAHWITGIKVYKKFNHGYFKDTPLKIDQTFIPFFSSYMLIPCSLLLLSGIWLLHCCSQCAHALNRILNSDTDTSLQETKYNIVNFRRDKKLSSASIVHHHYWGTV